MKHIKSFESKNIIAGDIVKYNYDDNIYFVYSISRSDNESLLYLYSDYKRFINDEIESMAGLGWINNDKLEEISEKEANMILDTKKYNI